MASNFINGFITGFANTTADRTGKRLDDAESYYQQQVDLARTRGLENRNRVQSSIDSGVSIANQLSHGLTLNKSF